jgi:nucleoside-diphosphate-sugar epimerase
VKILLTGAGGYIGSLMGPLLIERGHEVLGVDTGFFPSDWSHEAASRTPQIVAKDVRRIGDRELVGVDAVVHLAELSNDPLGALNPRVTWEVNHAGSAALADRARRAGVHRFVYASSCSVYGAGSDDLRSESSETRPQTAYAECKVRVEDHLRKLADSDFSPVILRNATAYGSSPRMRFDLVLNNLAGLAWTTGEIRLSSDGTPWRPLVHALDICLAFACALEAPREAIHGGTFNVGDDAHNYRVREIAQIVAESFPGCRVTLGRSDGDQRSYRVSFQKIRAGLPGFACRWDPARGAEELHRAFEQNQLDRQTFLSRDYTRVAQLRYLLETGQVDDRLFWIR